MTEQQRLIFRFNPLGAVLHGGALFVFFAGLVGAVFISDVLDWGRLTGALLCLVPSVCVSLPMVLLVSFGAHQHWIHQYKVRG